VSEIPVKKLLEFAEALPAFRAALSNTPGPTADAETRAPSSWLRALMEAVYLLASADGHLSDEGRRRITEELLALSEGQLTAEEVSAALDGLNLAVHEGASKLFHEIASIISDARLREAVFLVALAAAWGNGSMSERKELAVRALGHAFGFSEGKLQSLLSKARQVL
jgi:tellurite resistance protein